MKSEEQIKNKIEQLKTDFIEELSYDSEKRPLYQMVYKTLTWVLKDKQDEIIKDGE